MNESQTIGAEVVGQRSLFDYAALGVEDSVIIQQRTSEIKSLAKRVASDIVEIGGKLVEIRDRLKNGKFKEWLDAEFPNWSQRTAYNFIAVWQTYSSADFGIDGIAPSALYLLAAPSTPKAAREMAKQLVEVGEEVSHATAQEIVKQAKARKPKQESLIEEREEIEDVSETEEDADVAPASAVRTCRVCGCTVADCHRCVERAGAPCVWVGPDLCSACAKPVRVPVLQFLLDSMHKQNSAVAIDRGEPARLIQRGDEWLVITDSTNTAAHGVTFATGWRVVPEEEAGDIRRRSHPSELADEIAGYAESFLGVRVNARTTDKPEWWVVVGPEYEFEQFKDAPESTKASRPDPTLKASVVEAPSTPERPAGWDKARVEITITLMPGAEPRKVIHSVRAVGAGEDDDEVIPMVGVSSGEAALLAALPWITRGVFEKASASFTARQSSKPAKSAKPTTRSKPAAKKPATKSKAKRGKK